MRAKNKLVQDAIDAGKASGAAARFAREDSALHLAVKAPSAVCVSALSRRAGRINHRRAHDARAPRLSDW